MKILVPIYCIIQIQINKTKTFRLSEGSGATFSTVSAVNCIHTGPLTSGSVLVFYPFPHFAVLRMLIYAQQSNEINN